LGEGGAVGAWKGGFWRVYLGGGGIEDSVVAEGEDGVVYCRGMEVGLLYPRIYCILGTAIS